ncbi:MAG: hypothetical protein HY791_20170 [Deltaproteobacteria bacterium]|nr:hypothetical protein [Deltaproteobacteria bacterium]
MKSSCLVLGFLLGLLACESEPRRGGPDADADSRDARIEDTDVEDANVADGDARDAIGVDARSHDSTADATPDDATPDDATIEDAALDATDAASTDASQPVDLYDIPARVEQRDLHEMMARARCGLDERCGFAFSRTPSGACLLATPRVLPYLEILAELERLGKHVYDPDAMAACLTYLRDRPCDRLTIGFNGGSHERFFTDYFIDHELTWAAYEPCRRALLGTVTGSGGCNSPFECASGRCEYRNLACGSCAELRPLGADCSDWSLPQTSDDPTDPCGVDGYCDLAAGVCVAKKDEGAECGMSYDRCRVDLDCDQPATGGRGVCRAFVAEGSFCSSRGTVGAPECAGWLHCSGVCVREVDPYTDVNGSCGDSRHQCRPDLLCEGNRCVAPRLLDAPCDSRYGLGCADGLYCTGTSCRPLRPQGESCGYQPQCGSGLGCAFETHTCEPRRLSGEACSGWNYGHECNEPLDCLHQSGGIGVCGGDHGLQESCSASEDCLDALVCSNGQCLPYGVFLGCP